MRSISSDRTSPTSCAEKALLSRNTPMPASRFTLWLFMIVPVIRLYTFGSIIPTRVTASVAAAIRMMSLEEMHLRINQSRSVIPSFFIGRGW